MGNGLLLSANFTIIVLGLLVDRINVLMLMNQLFTMVMTQFTRSWSSTFLRSIRQLSVDLAIQLQFQFLGVVLEDAHAEDLDDHEEQQVDRHNDVPKR